MVGQRGVEIKFGFSEDLRFDEFEPVFQGVMTPVMQLVTEKVTGDAQRLAGASKDRGFFQQSIQPLVYSPTDRRPAITGEVVSTVAHAAIIEGVDEDGNETEYGRNPGTKFPDVGELRLWVERNIIQDQMHPDFIGPIRQNLDSDEVIDEITYFVGRKIVREGIKPKRPIGNAFRNNLAWINAQIDLGIDEVITSL